VKAQHAEDEGIANGLIQPRRARRVFAQAADQTRQGLAVEFLDGALDRRQRTRMVFIPVAGDFFQPRDLPGDARQLIGCGVRLGHGRVHGG
jgi:hypothetical protein